MRKIVTLLLLCACGSPATEKKNPSSSASEKTPALADGTHLDPSLLPAIGALEIEFPTYDSSGSVNGTARMEFCTATLISPTLAITAKHCLHEFGTLYYPDYYPMNFVVGEYSAGIEKSKIIASFVGPGSDGGWYLGLDVGFVRLETPITDVTPLPLANGVFSSNDIGRQFAMVGQGGGSDARYAGSVQLRATSGNYYEIFFGSVEAYGAALCEMYYLEAAACQPDGFFYQYVVDSYNSPSAQILEGRQAMFGGVAGNGVAQPGDSGGPTIGKQTNVDGSTSLVIYAVTTGYAFDANKGTFSALVGGQGAADTLAAAATWQDPCAGHDYAGVCDGDVATRCSAPGLEGPRTLVKTDCSLLNATCVAAASGTVTCGAAGAPAPADPVPTRSTPPARMAQSAAAVVSAVNASGAVIPPKPR